MAKKWEKVYLFKKFILTEFSNAVRWIKEDSKRLIAIGGVLVVLLLMLILAALSGREQDAGLPEANAEAVNPVATDNLAGLTAPEVPLEENAYPEINSLFTDYFKVLAGGDMDEIKKFRTSVDDTERIRIEKISEYIEKYQNIVCYTKPGVREGSMMSYVYHEAKFKDIDTPAPGMKPFLLQKEDDGRYHIYDGDLKDSEVLYLQEIASQDDVTNLCNTVEAKYNAALASDEKLAEFVASFENQVKQDVGVALAALEAEEKAAETSEKEKDEEAAVDQPVLQVKEVQAIATVNVRMSDSEKADKVGKVASGTRLQLVEKKDNGWTKVIFEGKEAYIISQYLADVVEVQDSTPEQTDTVTEPSKGKVVATDTVNVRASDSENGQKLGKITAGEEVELIEKQSNGWTRVKYKGQVAYIKSDYLR